MYHSRRVVALTAVAFLSSCGANSSMSSIPQTAPQNLTTQQSQTTQIQTNSADRAVAPAPTATKLAAGEVFAGAGFSDVSPHQLVRTSGNVLYAATPSCISYPTCYDNTIAMEAGNKAGNPTSYSAKDAAHQPTSTSAKDAIGSSALAIDENDVIWVAYNTRNEGTHVKSFDTKTNLWGRDFRIGTTSAGGSQVTQGKEGVGIAVEKNGKPHVVFTFIGSDGEKHIATAQTQGSAWSATTQIDDSPLGAGQGALHPTIAYTPKNVMLVAWLVGNENKTYNNPDGKIYVRAITSLAGSPPSYEIPDTIKSGQTGYAATVIDQGPSLLVTGDGVAHISYLDTGDYIRYWSSNGTNYSSWTGLQPASQQTHDPSLGPDGSGGLYIYGHGTPAGNENGHGDNLLRMHLANGSGTWGPFEEVISDNNIDCSVSTRWAQFDNYFPTQIDFMYWNDHAPNMNYITAM